MDGFRGLGMDVVISRTVVVRARAPGEYRRAGGGPEAAVRGGGEACLVDADAEEHTGVVERPWSAPLEENVARAGVGVPPALPSADRRDPVSPT